MHDPIKIHLTFQILICNIKKQSVKTRESRVPVYNPITLHSILLIPGIYIYKGKTVSLYKGSTQIEPVIYDKSPLKVAEIFHRLGAELIHIVDLEGSEQNKLINKNTIFEIATRVKAKIQVAGGIRTMVEIDELFANNIHRVILGYGALNIFKEALGKYGEDRIYAGIKAKRALVDSDDLKEPLEVLDAAKEFKKTGAKSVVFKDLEAEGTFYPNYDEPEHLINFTGLNVYVSGGISESVHVKILKDIGVKGVIISRSFLEGKLSFKKGLKIA